MKPIYKSVILTRDALAVSLSLQANVYSGDATATQAVPAESLQGLRVQLVSPNVSGARDLIASGECTIDGATLNVSINAVGLIPGTHRLVVKAEYGTQTVVLYGLDITVPASFEEGDAQEFEDTITVVSTIGDGDSSGADASVYSKHGDGNAHITKPLSIGDGVASGDGAVASGYTEGEGSSINAMGGGAVAIGRTDGDNSSIQATSDGAVSIGYTSSKGSGIKATTGGAVAIGYTDGDNSSINAGGSGAVAIGRTANADSIIQASGDGAVASGYTEGEGSSINAMGGGAVAIGRTDGDNSSIQATSDGSGAVAIGCAKGDNSIINAGGSGAVAIGYTDGDNSSINAMGGGAVAIGYTDGDNSSINAGGSGAVAIGYTDGTSGNVEASGVASQTFGRGVQAVQNAQMVCGQCNVVDENDDYQFIVGNGADDEHRSNAFAVAKSGGIVLFKADGTPVTLTAAQIEALLALL